MNVCLFGNEDDTNYIRLYLFLHYYHDWIKLDLALGIYQENLKN